METSAGSEGSKKISWSQSLSPLEHKLFGSTPSNMDRIGVENLISEASNGKQQAITLLLMPLIPDQGVNREVFNMARKERRAISSIYLIGEKAFKEDSPLSGYYLMLNMGDLSDWGLAQGFNIEIIAADGNAEKFLSEKNTSLLLEQMTEESKRPKNTIRKLVKAEKIKVSFSNEDVGTVMHFEYNF